MQLHQRGGVVLGPWVAALAGAAPAVWFPPQGVQDLPPLGFGEGRFEEGGGFGEGEGDRRAHEHPWCRKRLMVRG